MLGAKVEIQHTMSASCALSIRASQSLTDDVQLTVLRIKILQFFSAELRRMSVQMHECRQCLSAECFCSVTGCVPMLSLASAFTRNPAAIIISTSRTRPKRSTVGGERRLTRTVGGEKMPTRMRRRGRWQPRHTGRMQPHPARGKRRRGRRRCLWR